ncbi:acyl-protein thioesterase 1 [Favolaschia claudopus]|uniref:Acyl-protein thioesterase 1 n=1 Tax=Favolaschia claudopus TaxID=2862362 RepID=A0AAW0EAS2_9AGAR
MAAIAPLKFLTVPALSRHTATVIFLHGLGDTGNGWKPVADMLKRENPHIKWVLPHAPSMPVTGNGGMMMPAWFDIYSFQLDTREDQAGMLKTVHSVNQLITAEVDAGIPANRIVLGGFSQGGAMTLLTGLSAERKLAGLVVLSSWLPMQEKIKAMVSDHAPSVPIFWGQGTDDPLVRPSLAERSAKFVQEHLRFPVTTPDGELKGVSYNTYEGVGHSTNMKELEDLKAWLKRALPPIPESDAA